MHWFKDTFGYKLHRYRGKDIDVTFIKERCTHVAACLRGEPKVFFEVRRPWVLPDLGQADKVAEVVESCPTGALHYERKDGGPDEAIPESNTVQVMSYGALNIRGHITVKDPQGEIILEDTRLSLCRCGKSKQPPLCDGRHRQSAFRDRGRFKTAAPFTAADTAPGTPLVIQTRDKGPYSFTGPFILVDSDGIKKEQSPRKPLCSCGKSDDMPYCDGSHNKCSPVKAFFLKLIGRPVQKPTS